MICGCESEAARAIAWFPRGRTVTFDGWLVHVLRVYEPGIPGRLSQLGLVQADTGVTPAILERSTSGSPRG